MRFFKYHGLGNDYLVFDPEDWPIPPTPEMIRRVCNRNFGIGSDGILYGPSGRDGKWPWVRIFNPDGSEAEKSGNGLRIFARYLRDSGKSNSQCITIHTLGGDVVARFEDNKDITIAMGRISFLSSDIPVCGPVREVINETLEIGRVKLKYCAASIGNPHCVIFTDKADRETACMYGPAIENDPRFKNRTNVQFVRVIDRRKLYVEIWERGAGYTLASGSSASAAAAAAYKTERCGPEVTVKMPGGDLMVRIDPDFNIEITGPVVRVAEGRIDSEIFSQKIDA